MGRSLYVYPIRPGFDAGKEFSSLLPSLPEWRARKALSYRFDIDRFLCAKAYALLRSGLREDYGIEDELRFAYSPSGKPSLAGHPELHFSLSHCPRAVACVISGAPVGIDVEEIQYDDALARTVLGDSEYASVATSGRRDVEFTRLWTVKESYLKMIGAGLADDLRGLDCSGADFDTRVDVEGGYVLTICADKVGI